MSSVAGAGIAVDACAATGRISRLRIESATDFRGLPEVDVLIDPSMLNTTGAYDRTSAW
jgi:hypothetical protein